MTWTVHLAKQYPNKLPWLIAALLVASVAGYFVLGPVGVIAVSAAVLGAVADFVFPLKYTLTSERAICHRLTGTTQLRWADVRRCYLDELGIKISPLANQTRLEAFRGVFLRFNGNREQVIEVVKRLRPADIK
ncbi:hypothetical protein LLG39_10915 [bacterium]|nr:hypothetical protein [bacterium]